MSQPPFKAGIAALALAAAVGAAQAGPVTYQVTDLGYSYVVGINNSGQVTGAYSTALQSGIFEDGAWQPLHGPKGHFSQVTGISTNGTVCGWIFGPHSPNDDADPVRWMPKGKLENVLPGPNMSGKSLAIAKNGAIVGIYKKGVFTSKYGKITDLGDDGGAYLIPTGINGSSTVVGTEGYESPYTPVINAGGVWSKLPLLGDSGFAKGIDDAGDVVGASTTATDSAFHATYYDGTSVTDLGVLAAGYNSVAAAINKRGEIVGYAEDVAGNHAVVFQDGGIVRLEDHLVGGSAPILNQAVGVNDVGQILVLSGEPGSWHGYVLTPVGP